VGSPEPRRASSSELDSEPLRLDEMLEDRLPVLRSGIESSLLVSDGTRVRLLAEEFESVSFGSSLEDALLGLRLRLPLTHEKKERRGIC
jgi:hypothetical protein